MIRTVVVLLLFSLGAKAHSVAFPRILGDYNSQTFGVLSTTYGTDLEATIDPMTTYFTEHDEFWTCKCCVRTDSIFNHIPSEDENVLAWFFVEQENNVYKPWKKDIMRVAFGENWKTEFISNGTVYKKDEFLKSGRGFETYDKVQFVTGVKRCDNGISVLIPKDHDISLSKALEYQKYLNKYYD